MRSLYICVYYIINILFQTLLISNCPFSETLTLTMNKLNLVEHLKVDIMKYIHFAFVLFTLRRSGNAE